MPEIGARVWAVRNATNEVVNAYGFGTYRGNEVIPGWDDPAQLARCESVIRRTDSAIGSTAAEKAQSMADRVLELARLYGANPKIELDSGGCVWGAECWWSEADDDTPARWAMGRRIVVVPAPERAVAR